MWYWQAYSQGPALQDSIQKWSGLTFVELFNFSKGNHIHFLIWFLLLYHLPTIYIFTSILQGGKIITLRVSLILWANLLSHSSIFCLQLLRCLLIRLKGKEHSLRASVSQRADWLALGGTALSSLSSPPTSSLWLTSWQSTWPGTALSLRPAFGPRMINGEWRSLYGVGRWYLRFSLASFFNLAT